MAKENPRAILLETEALYASGLTLTETGKILGITAVGVYHRLKKLGVSRRRCGAVRCPLTIVFANLRAYDVPFEAIADTYDLRAPTIDKRLKMRAFNRKAWASIMPFTDDEMALIYASYVESALSFPDIIDLVRDHRALVKDQGHDEKEAPQREKAHHLIDHRPNL